MGKVPVVTAKPFATAKPKVPVVTAKPKVPVWTILVIVLAIVFLAFNVTQITACYFFKMGLFYKLQEKCSRGYGKLEEDGGGSKVAVQVDAETNYGTTDKGSTEIE